MTKVNFMYQTSNKKSKCFLQVNYRKQLGFTLIELLITVAIIGILASIAYPSYTDFIIRSNRSEGQRELLRYANLQEQVFVDSRSYASNMTGLGKATATITTESGNYLLSVSAQTATTFTLKAEAKNSQTSDSACTPLTVDQIGTKTPAGCWER